MNFVIGIIMCAVAGVSGDEIVRNMRRRFRATHIAQMAVVLILFAVGMFLVIDHIVKTQ